MNYSKTAHSVFKNNHSLCLLNLTFSEEYKWSMLNSIYSE